MVQLFQSMKRALQRRRSTTDNQSLTSDNVTLRTGNVTKVLTNEEKVDALLINWKSECVGLAIAERKTKEVPFGLGLPRELHGEVVQFLAEADLLQLAQCNSAWMKACRNNEPWLALCAKLYREFAGELQVIQLAGHNVSKRVQKVQYAKLVTVIPDNMALKNSMLTEQEYREANIKETKARFDDDMMYQYELENVVRYPSADTVRQQRSELTAFIGDVGPWKVPLQLMPGEHYSCCK